jgi:23S rRNA (cytidine1920-2'-O)/16S rRNA (cytidine1409-2'-O)-methyltransferase
LTALPPNELTPNGPTFVSRGGLKLHHALRTFAINPAGLACADLGCSTGGFTDCLLQSGAASVTSIDTGYGILAWKLRQDPRVRVLERKNALHTPPESDAHRVDLVVMDLGWTPQRLALPAAARWLKPVPSTLPSDAPAELRPPLIISLIKPHYEDQPLAKQHGGILPDDLAEHIARRVIDALPALGFVALASCPSPIRGSAGKKAGEGNIEWLAAVRPIDSATR